MSEENSYNLNISNKIFEIGYRLDQLVNLYDKNRFPKVLMLNGNKGIGKFTLIYHFLHYVFDRDNYNLTDKIINENTVFNKQFKDSIFTNIIYLPGNHYRNIKIDDIRSLKKKIYKTSISNSKRFIIFDDVELFNVNSLSALLKIIEEPSLNNYFILINNKAKTVMDTITSRSFKINIFLNENIRIKIIDSLVKKYNLNCHFDYKKFYITPGNFLSFNEICEINEINLAEDFLENFKILLNLYKKKKNLDFVNMILFLTEHYFYLLKERKEFDIERDIQNKSFIINSIHKFISLNLNQNSLLNAINNRLSNG